MAVDATNYNRTGNGGVVVSADTTTGTAFTALSGTTYGGMATRILDDDDNPITPITNVALEVEGRCHDSGGNRHWRFGVRVQDPSDFNSDMYHLYIHSSATAVLYRAVGGVYTLLTAQPGADFRTGFNYSERRWLRFAVANVLDGVALRIQITDEGVTPDFGDWYTGWNTLIDYIDLHEDRIEDAGYESMCLHGASTSAHRIYTFRSRRLS